MRNIRTIEGALNLFEKNAIIQGEAIISGNYKICNKTHDIITKCINFLKKKNKMEFAVALFRTQKCLCQIYSRICFTSIIHKRK